MKSPTMKGKEKDNYLGEGCSTKYIVRSLVWREGEGGGGSDVNLKKR